MERVNLHIFLTNFIHESRVLKETKSISDSGLAEKIYIVGLWEPGLKEIEHLDSKRIVWRVPLRTRSLPRNLLLQVIKYFEFIIKIVSRLHNEDIIFVNCHNIDVLPIGLLIKIIKKAKLIYDPHELETETCGLIGTRKYVSKLLEKSLIRFTDRVVVVSDSIGEWYKDNYQLDNVYVVKNIPPKVNYSNIRSSMLKDKFKLKQDTVLYIYQGGLTGNRGIEIILDVFSRVDKEKHIAFMGYGEYEKIIKEFERRFKNIHFIPAVAPYEVMSYTSSADVGISLIENACLSYYYSMPNKLFEYFLSGIPMVVSDFPEMGNFITENDCGWKIPVCAEELEKIVRKITSDDIYMKRENISKHIDRYSWEREERVLYRVYERMLDAKSLPKNRQ